MGGGGGSSPPPSVRRQGSRCLVTADVGVTCLDERGAAMTCDLTLVDNGIKISSHTTRSQP